MISEAFPRRKRARIVRLLGAAGLIGILPLFFIDLDRWIGSVPPEVHALGHVGFFGLLALLLMTLRSMHADGFRLHAFLVLMIIFVIGVVIELVQGGFGRSASVRDLGLNLVGAAVAVSLFAPPGMQRRVLVGVTGALLISALAMPAIDLWDRAVARAQFPVLSTFDTRFEHRRWSNGTPVDTTARAGPRSLRLELEPGPWPAFGTHLKRSFGDWRGHGYLELSFFNPEDDPLRLGLSIRDREHMRQGRGYSNLFATQLTLERGWNDVRIPISDIHEGPGERLLDLDQIAEMAIFAIDLQRPRVVYLDRVRLSD